MHLIITDAWMAKSRAIYLSGTKLVLLGMLLVLLLMAAVAGTSRWVFLSAEDSPIAGVLGKGGAREDGAQRERFMRENIDVLARRLGEMQAKVMQLESLAERVSGLAGISASELKSGPGRGGALVGAHSLTMDELQATLADLDKLTDQRVDLMTVMESRLFDEKIKKLMVPTQEPVAGGNLGSAFGWRIDPMNGRSALHTGLDFPSAPGTPILAAAGGVVVTQQYHAEYGNLVEVDHGNNLITRYAHASKVWVKKGDLIRRGQKIAEVGTTGRSTGPHLHFEVLVQGVFQDPQKFLTAGQHLPRPVVSAGMPARFR